MFLGNVGWFSADYTALYPRRWNSQSYYFLTERKFVFRGFPHTLRENAMIIPRLGHNRFLSDPFLNSSVGLSTKTD
jgi:hypothetical protein